MHIHAGIIGFSPWVIYANRSRTRSIYWVAMCREWPYYASMKQVLRYTLILLIPFFLLSSCSKEKKPDLGAIEERVRAVLSLHTYEMVYKDISWVGQSSKLLGVFTTLDKRLLFSVRIRVRAGLDVRKGLRLEQVGETGVRIFIPEPEILLVDADEKSLEEYFSYEFGGKISQAEWDSQIALARERISLDAIERGILYKADQNARKILSNFLRLAGFTEIEFSQVVAGTEAKK